MFLVMIIAYYSTIFEDVFDIDYLNLKNGSFASNTFSLFYSENIQYACVDSIAAEYNEVQQHIAIGETLSINCVNSIPPHLIYN